MIKSELLNAVTTIIKCHSGIFVVDFEYINPFQSSGKF